MTTVISLAVKTPDTIRTAPQNPSPKWTRTKKLGVRTFEQRLDRIEYRALFNDSKKHFFLLRAALDKRQTYSLRANECNLTGHVAGLSFNSTTP